MDDLRSLLAFATDVAWQAGRLTLGHFQSGLQTEWKADDSPVTEADRAAERLIRARIAAQFPDHAIVGEEYGEGESADSRYRWFIDPIDGTKSFVSGVPLYAVLLGLEIAGRVEVGVACFPALGEMVAAATGQGCWWNGRPCRVTPATDLSRVVVSHADTASFARLGPARGAAWQRLSQAGYYNAGWCDAYGYLLVATGRIGVMLDPIMNVWDCAPFPPILREAGGYFGDWQGRETIYGNEALATTPALLPQVLPLLAKH
jgi:myo-inositol-1(or 4)-monophosphatase